VGSALVGLFLSYWLDIASGATIVLTATVIFFLAALLSPRRRRWRWRMENERDHQEE
jgi:ABC-type Mn2+/Zn2+ transport system permease subunit